MTAAAIDLNTLNELLDNQKKLDDIFSSVFDDDSFLDSSRAVNQRVSRSSHRSSENVYHAETNILVQKSRSAAHAVMPVLLEIAVIYYCIMNFS